MRTTVLGITLYYSVLNRAILESFRQRYYLIFDARQNIEIILLCLHNRRTESAAPARSYRTYARNPDNIAIHKSI